MFRSFHLNNLRRQKGMEMHRVSSIQHVTKNWVSKWGRLPVLGLAQQLCFGSEQPTKSSRYWSTHQGFFLRCFGDDNNQTSPLDEPTAYVHAFLLCYLPPCHHWQVRSVPTPPQILPYAGSVAFVYMPRFCCFDSIGNRSSLVETSVKHHQNWGSLATIARLIKESIFSSLGEELSDHVGDVSSIIHLQSLFRL